MKRFIQVLSVIVVFWFMAFPVLADEYTQIQDYTDKVNSADKVYDFANLLTDSEKTKIQKEIDRAAENTKLDIVVLTVDKNLGYSQRRLADDFYDYGGFGDTGILLLVDMQAREIYISTAGIAILYFNDTVIETILDDITDNASAGNYKRLCEEFCEDVVYYTNMAVNTDLYKNIIEEWNTGKYQDYHDFYEQNRKEFDKIGKYNFDYNEKGIVTKDKTGVDFYHMKYKGYHNKTFFTIFRNPLVDFIIGAIVSLITIPFMLNHKGNGMTASGRTYQTENGFQLGLTQDKFIRRSTVSHTIQSSSNTSSKGNSGGGSHHSSSSGRSHGGGGRKF